MKKKNKKNMLILLIVAAVVGFYFIGKDVGLFTIVTTTAADRDVSLARWGNEYPSMSDQDIANNFLIFNDKANAEQLKPENYNLVHMYIRNYYRGGENWSTVDSHENWFIHGDGLDPTVADNRVRYTGGFDYRMNIQKSEYKDFVLQRAIEKTSVLGVDGLYIGAYNTFGDCCYWTYVNTTTTASSNGLSINVTRKPFVPTSSTLNPIIITTDAELLGENKYGGSYNGNTIFLVHGGSQNITNNAAMEITESTTDTFHYPEGIKPKDFAVGYNCSIIRVTPDGDTDWLLTVLGTDASWMRRLAGPVKTVGVNATVYVRIGFQNYENATKVCNVVEKRREGISYGGTRVCYDNPLVGSNLDLIQTYTLPVDTSCGGQACDQTYPYIEVNTLNGTSAKVKVNYFVYRQIISIVRPGQTLYVRYGAEANVSRTATVYTAWHQLLKGYFDDLAVLLPSKTIIVDDVALGGEDYMDNLEGGVYRGFIRYNWNRYNDEAHLGRSGTEWLSQINSVKTNIIDKNKLSLLYCGTHQNPSDEFKERLFNYCFTSYLLVQERGKTAFTFTGSGDTNKYWYFDQYDYKIGMPISSFGISQLYNGVYSREYEKVLVLVNPTMDNIVVPLRNTYFLPGGSQVDSIAMTNRSGVILFKSIEDTPEDEPDNSLHSNFTTYMIIGVIATVVLYLLFGKKKRR